MWLPTPKFAHFLWLRGIGFHTFCGSQKQEFPYLLWLPSQRFHMFHHVSTFLWPGRMSLHHFFFEYVCVCVCGCQSLSCHIFCVFQRYAEERMVAVPWKLRGWGALNPICQRFLVPLLGVSYYMAAFLKAPYPRRELTRLLSHTDWLEILAQTLEGSRRTCFVNSATWMKGLLDRVHTRCLFLMLLRVKAPRTRPLWSLNRTASEV